MPKRVSLVAPPKRTQPSLSSASSSSPATPDPPRYHHGDLKAGLLEAAERILVRDGIQALTLRAAAREAGVSHAAPKNHFGDLTGLLSELAAVGFARFNAATTERLAAAEPGADRMSVHGAAYVRFGRANPGLFLLMFRSERLDFTRPALRDASASAFDRLAGATGAPVREGNAGTSTQPGLSVAEAAGIVAAWSFVHGLTLLAIDGRLKQIVDRLPPGVDEAALLEAIARGRS